MIENEYIQTIKLVEINVDDRTYYLEIKDVREIYVPELIIPIPLAEKSIVGVADIRGKIYTIIALGQRLHSNGDYVKLTKDSRLVLLELQDINLAIYVDSVVSMKEVPVSIFQNKSAIIKTEIDMKYIRSVGVLDHETYVVLDLESLIVPLAPDQQLMRASHDFTQLPERYIPERFPALKKTEDIIIPTGDKFYQPIVQGTMKLTQTQKDTLQEVGNIGSGNAVTALSRLINKRIDVDLTDVGIISLEQLALQFGNSSEIVCGIFSHIRKPSLSTILQVFELTPLMKLIADLAGKKSKINPDKVKSKKDLDDFAISTVTEFGNILAGHYASALADLLNTKMIFDVPEFTMSNAGNLGDFLAKELQEQSEYVVIIKTAIKVTDIQMKGIFFYIPDLKAIENLFKKLNIYEKIENVKPGGVLDKIIDLELTEIQKDALREVGNIGAGNAANALAKMINKRVDINIPSVEVVSIDQFAKKMSKKNVKLFVSWSGVQGKTRATVLTLFKVPDITSLTSIIIGDNGKEKIDLRKVNAVQDFPELYIDAMKELGHILASHYTTALGNLLNMRLMTEPPDISLDTGMKLFKILNEEIGLMKELSLVITTNVIIKEFEIQGTFLFIPELETLQELLDTLSTFYDV
ncbi:MAG: chemotaxis protein CheC [Promethearchaeota archaeon]